MLTIVSEDLFKAALRKCGGIIAEGESISADLMEDTRMAFNVMLDAWSAERLAVYTGLEQTFTWPSGYATRTLGPTGNLVGIRPVQLEGAFFRDSSGIDTPLTVIETSTYDGIGLKTTPSSSPQYISSGAEVPNTVLSIYPVPSTSIELHLMSIAELTQVDNLFTNIVFPPGYQRAFIFNLAVEMCMEFGVEPPPTTVRIAKFSRRVLKAQNAPKDQLEFPNMFSHSADFNIYTGE